MNEAQALTLEVGKYYLTREGKRAFVSGNNPFTYGSHIRLIGVVDGWGVQGWDANGVYTTMGQHYLDLVAEWVEPKRIKGWVNIYPHPNMPQDVIVNNALYETKEKADGHSVGGRIACIEIDVLEGHGLNGEAA